MYYYYRRRMKFAFGLLIFIGLVYLGIKGVMYYNASRAMSEIQDKATGHAEISYDGIETALSGVVRIRDLAILPEGASEPIKIDSARVSGPKLPFFLWGGQGKQKPPPQLRLDLEGIHIALDESLFDSMRNKAMHETQPMGDGCGANEGANPALLRELGLDALSMDATLSYHYDDKARQLALLVELDVHQVERITAGLDLGDVDPEALTGKGGLNSLPSLAGLRLDLRVEPEFGDKYLAACAKRRGQDVEVYRKASAADTLAGLSRSGLQLGPGLSWVVEAYHQQWGDLHISAEPPTPLNLMAMLFAPPENWQRQLGVRVALNRMEVQDLRFELRPPDSDELAVMLGAEPPVKARPPQDRYRYAYHDASVATLSAHIGAEVRLYLRNEQPLREGTLQGIVANEARVEQRVHGGKVTAHVPLGDIVRLEVRRIEKIPSSAKK